MEKYPKSDIAVNNLLQNRLYWGKKLGTYETDHNPPSPHYPGIYLWDEVAAAIVNARHGGEYWRQAAIRGQRALFNGQREDGFIPNNQYPARDKKLHARMFDPEIIFCFDKSSGASNYTQPPIPAVGVNETYASIREHDPSEAMGLLQEMYPKLDKFYGYFDKYRSNSEEDKLIGVIHPHETGRDSDPTFDFIKPLRMQRRGLETSRIVDLANISIDYLSIFAHGRKLKQAGGDVNKSREIFWVNDVMMNCMYAHNLYEMSDLANQQYLIEDQIKYTKRAQKVEQDILEKMWVPNARNGRGAFYALNKDKSPIEEISISNLFPLTLPNITESQLESILDLMDESFDTPFPLPSVAMDSPNFDPHNRELDRLWRGPDWMIVMFYLVEYGLKTQINRTDLRHRGDLIDRCIKWEDKIINSAIKLLDMNGPMEHYNPYTGKGQRPRVKNFGWSNLGYVMLHSDKYHDYQIAA